MSADPRPLGVAGFALLSALAATPAAAAPARQIVAVFDIESSGARLGRVELERLGDYLMTKVASFGSYQVVPRAELRRRLREQKRDSHRLCYDQSCQIEVGRELAAQKSLSTKILRLGGQCVVTLALYDLRRSATEGGADATGGCGIGALVRSIETAVQKLTTGSSAPAASKPIGVVDRRLCPEAGTRRMGAPHPQGSYAWCVDSKGVRQGRSIQWYPNGRVLSEGRYRDNQQTGPWTTYHRNGKQQTRVGYRDGKRHGQFVRWDEHGVRSEIGRYERGVKVDTWTRFYPDGATRRSEEPHVNDDVHGLVTRYHDNGSKSSECAYRRGARHGRCVHWDASGAKSSEIEYRQGKRNGRSIRYLGNGRRWVTTFRDDKQHGPAMRYNEHGKAEEGRYRDGERDGRWVTYTVAGGQQVKHAEATYRAGKLHGRRVTYRTHGSAGIGAPASEEHYRDGRRDGRYSAYDAEGNKTVEGTYRDNRRHGRWRYYSRGQLTREVVYDEDKVVSQSR